LSGGKDRREGSHLESIVRVPQRALAAITVAGYAALYRFGSVSGSTPAERGWLLPWDELIS